MQQKTVTVLLCSIFLNHLMSHWPCITWYGKRVHSNQTLMKMGSQRHNIIKTVTINHRALFTRMHGPFLLTCTNGVKSVERRRQLIILLIIQTFCPYSLQAAVLCSFCFVPGWWKLGESSLATALAISESWEADCPAWSAASPLARAWDVLQKQSKTSLMMYCT